MNALTGAAAVPRRQPANKDRPTRSAKLRHMLQSEQLEFLMKLTTAFRRVSCARRVWRDLGVGPVDLTQFGVRDNNEASWTQCDIEFMAEPATCHPADAIPHGNFTICAACAKLEQRGIAGVCIEDKQFRRPIASDGERQPLADIAESPAR